MDDRLATFQELRPLLFSIAYRMLGSASEAEDILQDTYLRFLPAPLSDIESPRAYLCTIVTRLCLNQLTSARAQRETYVGPWLPEPILSANYPDLANPEARASQYDAISLAFLALLERLTPAERAAFILREVFDYDYAEISHVLDKSEAACRKLVSRAKADVDANRPRFEASPEEHRHLLEEFMRAVGDGDLEGLTALLAEDVTLQTDGGGKVRGAAVQPIHGRASVARFALAVTARTLPPDTHTEVTEVNGKPAWLIRYAAGTPVVVISIETDGKQIRSIWTVVNPDKLGAL